MATTGEIYSSRTFIHTLQISLFSVLFSGVKFIPVFLCNGLLILDLRMMDGHFFRNIFHVQVVIIIVF